jgi:hypothetical protein
MGNEMVSEETLKSYNCDLSRSHKHSKFCVANSVDLILAGGKMYHIILYRVAMLSVLGDILISAR